MDPYLHLINSQAANAYNSLPLAYSIPHGSEYSLAAEGRSIGLPPHLISSGFTLHSDIDSDRELLLNPWENRAPDAVSLAALSMIGRDYVPYHDASVRERTPIAHSAALDLSVQRASWQSFSGLERLHRTDMDPEANLGIFSMRLPAGATQLGLPGALPGNELVAQTLASIHGNPLSLDNSIPRSGFNSLMQEQPNPLFNYPSMLEPRQGLDAVPGLSVRPSEVWRRASTPVAFNELPREIPRTAQPLVNTKKRKFQHAWERDDSWSRDEYEDGDIQDTGTTEVKVPQAETPKNVSVEAKAQGRPLKSWVDYRYLPKGHSSGVEKKSTEATGAETGVQVAEGSKAEAKTDVKVPEGSKATAAKTDMNLPEGSKSVVGSTGVKVPAGSKTLVAKSGLKTPERSKAVAAKTGAKVSEGSKAIATKTGAKTPDGSKAIAAKTVAKMPEGSKAAASKTGAKTSEGSKGSKVVAGKPDPKTPEGSKAVSTKTGVKTPEGSKGIAAKTGVNVTGGSKVLASKTGGKAPDGSKGPKKIDSEVQDHVRVKSKQKYRKVVPDASKESQLASSSTEEKILWPPAVVIYNTRIGKTAEGTWDGMGGKEMDTYLKDIGHEKGKSKPIWGKQGHKGLVLVRFKSNLSGMQEAERLHEYFESNGRGRHQWLHINSGEENSGNDAELKDGADFVHFDPATKESKRILYGFLAGPTDFENLDPTSKIKFTLQTKSEILKKQHLLEEGDK